MRLVTLVCCLAAVVSADNLLLNPGFETWDDDSTPSAWTVENRSRATVLREADTVASGSFSARLVRRDLNPGSNTGLIQRVRVLPNTGYRLSVSCLDDNDEVRLGIGVSWRDPDSGYISSSGVTYSADSFCWQQLSDTVMSPVGAGLADVRMRTYSTSGLTRPRRILVDGAGFSTDSTPGPVDSVSIWFAGDSLWNRLIDFIDGARISLDYCHYNSSRPNVVQALLDAHFRGVHIRVITDDSRLDDEWVARLRSAGVRVWTDSIGPNSDYLMHDKFMVRDLANADSADDRVWVASYNPNDGEFRADFAVEIAHTGIASAYVAEFNQLWGSTGPEPDPARAQFHIGKQDVLATHDFELNGFPVRVFFGPQDRPVDTVTALVSDAQRHLLFCILSFTHDQLGDAMLGLWSDSTWVGGVIDKSGAFGTGSEYPRLSDRGLPVYIDSVPFGEGVLHMKAMVIDSVVTIAGSANWSTAGNERNDENVIEFHDPAIARRFLRELHQRHWEASNPAIGEGEPTAGPPWFRDRASRVVRAVSFTVPEDVLLFDAMGRRLRFDVRPSPGIYFLQSQTGNHQSVVSRLVITP